jgi:hypothetical protein
VTFPDEIAQVRRASLSPLIDTVLLNALWNVSGTAEVVGLSRVPVG